MDTKKCYKIRREDGMYSKGGTHPYFDSKGKTWWALPHLKSHIRQLSPRGLELYKGCVIVTIEVTQTELSTNPVGMFIKGMHAQRELEERLRKEREAQMIEDAERREWQRLNEKYGNQN